MACLAALAPLGSLLLLFDGLFWFFDFLFLPLLFLPPVWDPSAAPVPDPSVYEPDPSEYPAPPLEGSEEGSE